ncbi:MAG: winged helix-turn-helix transcriptional regulator [Cyanobacteria bacterium SZAS-4]|nr:winged helix-turn-helix transcriptional regulator [Cyanobacteria bacterium SZAS-4]
MTESMVNFTAQLFKAVSTPLRIRILNELRGDELTVSEIGARLKVGLPSLSQQLSVLRAKNLVGTRKHGSNIFYSCKDKTIFRLLDVAKKIFDNHLVDVERTLREIR